VPEPFAIWYYNINGRGFILAISDGFSGIFPLYRNSDVGDTVLIMGGIGILRRLVWGTV
jgi:hypothetical protein